MSAISRPLREHHAIESATFVVILHEALDKPHHDAVLAALDQFSDELPGTQPVAPDPGFIKIQFFNQQPQPEITRFITGRDGQALWRVTIDANVVQVTCHDYTSFDLVLQRAMRYLTEVLNAVGPNYLVLEAGLQYVDKFVYDMATELDYDINELFRPGSRYLTEQARASGLFWHVYQGWFEPRDMQSRFLHQLNLSNVELPDRQVAALIDYRGTVRGTVQPLSLSELIVPEGYYGASPLELVFRQLHDTNRTLLENLLTDVKLQQIGMRSHT